MSWHRVGARSIQDLHSPGVDDAAPNPVSCQHRPHDYVTFLMRSEHLPTNDKPDLSPIACTWPSGGLVWPSQAIPTNHTWTRRWFPHAKFTNWAPMRQNGSEPRDFLFDTCPRYRMVPEATEPPPAGTSSSPIASYTFLTVSVGRPEKQLSPNLSCASVWGWGGPGGVLIFPRCGARSLSSDPRTPELPRPGVGGRATRWYRVHGPLPAMTHRLLVYTLHRLSSTKRRPALTEPSATPPTYSFSTTWQATINTGRVEKTSLASRYIPEPTILMDFPLLHPRSQFANHCGPRPCRL